MEETIELIKKYIQTKKIQLCILTPCYGSSCNINYVESLIMSINFFKTLNLNYKIYFCHNDSLVSRARNNLMAKAMSDILTTHIIYIDSDIRWDPYDIIKLIMSEKDIIGGIYALKKYNWNKLLIPNYVSILIDNKRNTQLDSLISDEKMIQNNLLRYNINYKSEQIEINNNMTEVKHLATGFMMIKREVIEKMMKEYSNTKYKDDVGFLSDTEDKYTYALFDCGVIDNHYYSEDWLFCDRWSKIGGEIWVDITIKLVHYGIESYDGNYLASIINNGLKINN